MAGISVEPIERERATVQAMVTVVAVGATIVLAASLPTLKATI
jgi:hypothetical protein